MLKLNKAVNSGGSISIRHGQALIQSCTFSNESVVSGYGGAITAENVANVTIQGSSFYNCMASYGGSVSVKSESILRIKHSNVADSFAMNEGGGLCIIQNSFVTAHNITITDGISQYGGGFHVDESSEINLSVFNFLVNCVSGLGGSIYCRNSLVTLEKGNLLQNYAEKEWTFRMRDKGKGGAIFGVNCHVVFDYVQITNNTASIGGGMYFETSVVEMHNSEGVNNTAIVGSFAILSLNSDFKSYYLHIPEAGEYSIAIFDSKAEMKHTYLLNLEACCIFAFESHILLDPIYYTYLNSTRRTQGLFENSENIVCTDDSSNSLRVFKG